MISRDNLEDLYPLAPMQEGMLFAWLLDPDSEAYREQIAYRLRGHLDITRFEASWNKLAKRHDILRTVFVPDKTARPLQMVLKKVAVRFDVEDLRALAHDAKAARLAAYRQSVRALGFDLAGELPWRVAVVLLSDDSMEVVWTFHHILLDGWSAGLLMAELLRCYGAAGDEPRDSAIPYSHYIKWLEARDRDLDRRFWREQLQGFVGPSSIPSSRPGWISERYERSHLAFTFSAAETDAFNRLARGLEVTPGTLAQALWAIVLSRYQPQPSAAAGSHDLAFGIVVAGRPPALLGAEGMIGLFTNTLPLRVRFDEDETLAAVLVRLQSDIIAAQEHAYLPLPDIQTEPGMIDHLVAFENYPRDARIAASMAQAVFGFTAETVDVVEQGPYHLNIIFAPAERLSVNFYYDAARYDAAQIDRLFGQLHALALAAMASPRSRIRDLDIVPESESRLLRSFAGPAVDRAGPPTVHEAIAAQVRATPDAAAIIADDCVLTYAQLDARAAHLSSVLRSDFGLTPGDRVAVVLSRGADLPLLWLAIMRAGGIYLPIDPIFPDQRIAMMVQDAECSIVLTSAARCAALQGLLGACVRDAATLMAGGWTAQRMDDAPAQQIAYVIYTSGSTGVPKGVAVSQAGVLNATAYLGDLHRYEPGDRVVFFASPSFDASIWEMCAALCHGATLMVADRDTVADPEHFGAFLVRSGCTITVLPPSYVRLLDVGDLIGLKLLTTAGEAVHPDTVERLSSRVRYVNLYGPTEASILVSAYEVSPGARFSRSVPIGRPIPNVDALVLDHAGRLAPVGAPGELCVGGVCVALGYLNRPELTAERFPPHPLKADQRIYRTGDIVRWLDDGTLEFIGRTDDQVKIRGHRIELGEIQARLLSCRGVRQAGVIVEQDDDGEAELAAYLVLDDNAGLAEVREQLQRVLPEYMLPSRLVTLDELPLTPQGKLNRAALPKPIAVPGSIPAAPRDALEAGLLGIWQSALGVNGIGIHDRFFDLGGHSLTAVRIAARIRKELAHRLQLRDLFQHPTVAELAVALRDRKVAAFDPIPQLADAADYAASHAQERLWLLHHLSGQAAAYNIAGAFLLDGAIDATALDRAGAALMARHDALRTTYVQVGGRLRQRIQAVSDGPVLERRDVSGAVDAGAAAMGVFQDAQSRPFDLEQGPLVRMLLIEESPNRHLFAIVLHHIVADGWSVDILARELSQLYAASVARIDARLPPLRIRYCDAAAWLNARPMEAHAAYWRKQLGSAAPARDLPTDKPRPARRSFRGATLTCTVSAACFRGLTAMARSADATLFMVLVAVVKILLARAYDQESITVGYPAAGRDHPDLDGQVGFFINTIALRNAVRPKQTFSSLLAAVRETVLGGLEHQAYPFDQLVEELGVARDPSRHPIFDVMIAYDRSSGDKFQLPGVLVGPVTADSGTSKFDLLFAFNDDGASLQAMIEYSTDLFEATTITRMQGHLLTLLAEVVDAPDVVVSSLHLLTAEERRAVRSEPAAPLDLASSESLVSRFGLAAAAAFDSLAVVCDTERLTYGELNARATALACALLAYGAGRDLPVGLSIDRSADMLVGMLGILKAGSAYLPLDPSLPASRLRAMMCDANARVVVSHSRLAPLAAEIGAPILWLDGSCDRAPVDRLPQVGGRDLAYVLYTSGSTGRPNGVLVEHRNVLALLDAYAHLAPPGATLAGTTLCPFGFDVSVWEIFSCLCSGGALHVLSNEIAANPAKLVRYFGDHGISSAYLPPAIIDDVARDLASGGRSSLDRLLVGVEPIRQMSLIRLQDAVPGLRIVNGYGPTETTVCATFLLFQGGAGPDGPTPIGRAARGYEVYLLDAGLQYVPLGMIGEIYIGGAGLARGYAGNATLTAQRFVPNPFLPATGTRLYRTGDLARRLPDGNIQFLGRADRQVKVRGFRVEPGEIESALRAHPAVQDATVIAVDAATGGKELVAYVAGEVPKWNVLQIKAHLKARLPDYMVPAVYMPLPVLPRTANGKVDRDALPPPPATHIRQIDGAPPATPTEAVLQRLWSEVLRLEGIGCDDDFFDVGGHSLLAMRLLGRIREACKVEVPLQILFETPTVRATAAYIDATARSLVDAWWYAPIGPVARDQALPLSFAQQRLWFLDQLEPGPAYNIPIALELEGDLEPTALERALNAVVARHESLRTRFMAIDGVPRQMIVPERPVTMSLHDLSSLHDPSLREREVRQRVASLASLPFDLGDDALLRASLLNLAPDRHVLVLSIHHIVADGWSAGVLMREFAAALVGETLPPLPIQYADFAAWQRDPRHQQVVSRELDYWRRQLADLPPLLALPTDRPRTADRARKAGLERFTLGPTLTADLKQLARDLDATFFMTLLAALDVVLARLCGQSDIAVGTPIANRDRPEIEPLIGFFANTVVLRVGVDDHVSFSDLVGRVRKVALEAYANQNAPFEQVVEALQPGRSLGHTPLFQVMFVLQSPPGESASVPNLRVRALEQPVIAARFDLSLVMQEGDGSLEGAIEYDADLFDAKTIGTVAAALEKLLAGAVAQPNVAAMKLPLLSSVEQRNIIERQSCNVPAAADATVTALVAAQFERTPAAIAIDDGANATTYAELDARANQIAHYLRTLGAGPGVRVGLSQPRCADMLIALLGIMKAGAAAVPLDPLYPAERLSLMLGDAAVTIVIGPDVGGSAHRIDLTRDRQTIAAQPTSRPAVESVPDDLLFITFTSGTTGIPKGVLMTQRIFANMLVWGHGQGFAAPARTLQFAPITFDVSLQEIYTCWTSGGSLVLIDDERRRDSAALLAFLRARRIERLFVPVVALQSLAETAAGLAVGKLALKQIIAAGEQLRLTSQLADLVARLDGCELHNQYGPSETYGLTACRMTGSPSRWPSLPPIGEAVAGARLYVLDPHGHLVPPGFPGELYAGGIVIGPGYANRPELTAERFVPAPFGGEGLLYRTGDLVRLRADGNYEFLGRNDAQLKIRGFRVEPAEIELVLTRHAAVAQAAIVADDRQRLVAYVVAAAGATIDPAALRAHAGSKLPAYMLPSAFVVLDALPLTSNGKLDKRALPMPIFTDAPARLAPRTATEEQLARIWRELLGLESVGITESFFDVGGHSLLATRLTSRILATFGVAIPLKRLFEAPTIAGIAAMVDASGPRTPASAIPRAPRGPDMPCSFAQERLWYLSALQEHDATYNMPGALRLCGVLDVAALAAALGDLVDRHEVLRTRLIERGGRIVQDIVPNATPDLTVSDLSDWPIGDREAQVSSRINEFARRPFDLARDLPCRFALLRCGPAEHILLIAVHHAAADGWSLGIIAREVTALYASNLGREPSRLPALPIQYADFAAWQRDWLTGENCAALRDYWKVQLAGAPMRPTLPASRPRPLRRSFRGATLPFTVNRVLTERLRAAAKEHNVTLYTMLLTAYAATLHRLSGQADFVIATPTAGRSRPEIEPLVGLFVNLLPIRIRISESDTLTSLIDRVRDTILDAFSHEALPFEKIVEDFAPERNLSGQTPLSEVVFALQNWPHQPLRMAGLTIVPETYESFAAKHDLTLSMDDTMERLSGTMDYATDLFELEAIEQMITSFVDCLETVADSIDAPLFEAGTASAAIQADDFAFNESLSDD